MNVAKDKPISDGEQVDQIKLSPEERAAHREEFEELHKRLADSMTDTSPDPKDPRKLGPPLTKAEQLRLHELHYLV